MRKSRFSPIQIAKIFKEFDIGKSVEYISREHGVNSASFYKSRSRYSGISYKELKCLKELEEENRKRKITKELNLYGINRTYPQN